MLCLYPGSMTLPTSNTTPEMLKALVNNLRGKTICGVKIHDAKAELSEGSDFEPCVAVVVLMDDPRPELNGWSGSTIIAIQRETREIAASLGFSEWAYVRNYIALKDIDSLSWTSPMGVADDEH